MGITLHPNYWRQGLGVEAHLAVLQHSFEVMGLHRIEFMTSDDNKPMRDFYDKFSI
jgi:RimJ/RimL family protein N-acetyltransferase